MMRVKLGLTDAELMNKSWIALCLETADFPYYHHGASKEVITDPIKANSVLDKYMK